MGYLDNKRPVVKIDGMEALNLMQNMVKVPGKNHAYYKGVRDCYNMVRGLIEYELERARKDAQEKKNALAIACQQAEQEVAVEPENK